MIGIEIVSKFDSPILPNNSTPLQISFSDFIGVMLSSELARNTLAMEFTFSLIDSARTGYITSTNLYFQNYLLGLSINSNEIAESTAEFGNKIDFIGFVRLLSQGILIFN